MLLRITILLSLLCLLAPVSHAERISIVSSNYYPHYGEELPQQGAVLEIIRRAFALQGVETNITFMPFARAYREAQTANYTALAAPWYDEVRTQYFFYSEPLYPNHLVFFKKKHRQITYQNYQDLAQQGYRLAVVQGYSQPQGLLESGLKIEKVASDQQMFQMLALDRVDLVIADRLNGMYQLQRYLPQQQHNFDWLHPAAEIRPMYLMLSRQDNRSEELLNRFNRGLKQLKESGQYQQIIDDLLPQHN